MRSLDHNVHAQADRLMNVTCCDERVKVTVHRISSTSAEVESRDGVCERRAAQESEATERSQEKKTFLGGERAPCASS